MIPGAPHERPDDPRVAQVQTFCTCLLRMVAADRARAEGNEELRRSLLLQIADDIQKLEES